MSNSRIDQIRTGVIFNNNGRAFDWAILTLHLLWEWVIMSGQASNSLLPSWKLDEKRLDLVVVCNFK